MKDSSLLISIFASYASCVNELKIINTRREEFINSMPGTTLQGISFEETAGSTAKNYQLSKLSDDIEEWDKRNCKTIEYCNYVISICDSLVKDMVGDTKKIFKLRFLDNLTLEETGIKLGYSKSSLSRRIRNECKRLSEI